MTPYLIYAVHFSQVTVNANANTVAILGTSMPDPPRGGSPTTAPSRARLPNPITLWSVQLMLRYHQTAIFHPASPATPQHLPASAKKLGGLQHFEIGFATINYP